MKGTKKMYSYYLRKGLFFFVIIGSFLWISNFVFSVEIQKKAPNFTAIDSYGKQHQLSDYKGKIVVLEWKNIACPFVKKHYKSKNMQSLQKEAVEDGIVWLSVVSSTRGKQGYQSNEDTNKQTKNKYIHAVLLR